MKSKYIKLFSALAIIAMAMTSCQKEGTTKTLAIKFENYKSDTKGMIGGDNNSNTNQLAISNGDVLNINNNLYTVNGYNENAQVSDVELADSYTAAYPGQNSSSANNGSATIAFPTSAHLSIESEVLTPAMAYATADSPSLKFYNCGALIKMIVRRDFAAFGKTYYIESITVTDVNNQPIAGTYTFAMANSDAVPAVVLPASNTSNEVALVPSNGSSTMINNALGVNGYFPMAPVAGVKLKIKLVVKDNNYRYVLERTQSNNFDIIRNKMYTVQVTLPSSLNQGGTVNGFTVVSKTSTSI